MARIAVILGVGVLAAGCEKDVRIASFSADETLPAMTIQGNPIGGALTSGPSPVKANVKAQAEFQAQEFDYVQSIEVTGLRLRITPASTDVSQDPIEDGNADTFDFLDSVDVYIEATIGGTSQRQRVAFLPSGDPQLAAGATAITLQTTGADVLPYIEAPDGYKIAVEATGSIPPDAVIFDGVVDYRVTVGTKR